MFQTKVEKINTHLHSLPPPLSENRAVYEIISQNVVEPGRPQMTIWRMRVACWISNARRARTHARALAHPPTHTETRTHARLHARTPTEKYVKLNAFPRQLFREGHSVLGCVHTVPLYARWHCQNCWKNRAKWLANSNPTIVSPLQRKPRHF